MPRFTQEELLEHQRRIALYEDESSYKHLFKSFYLYLVRFSHSMTNDRSLSEDIVSEVFMSLWKNRSRILEIDDIKLYLYISVKNNTLKELQKRQKNVQVDLSSLEFQADDHFLLPESSLLNKELHSQIQTAIEKLPPRAKLIFKLAKEDRLPYKKIAEILEVSIKTIDNQLSIALKKLAVELKLIHSSRTKK
jgi:RNA polymerase sigma-70 factor (ECF subfamily)